MTLNRRSTDVLNDKAQTAVVAEVEGKQFVSFALGDQEYVLDIMFVREIKAWTGTTRLPNSPDHMRGVINLRGAIVPVVDLKMRFGGGATETTTASVIIIVATENTLIGLLVDGVSDIITVAKSEIAAIPDVEKDNRDAYFSGLITVEGNLLPILALDSLLKQENMAKNLLQSTYAVPAQSAAAEQRT